MKKTTKKRKHILWKSKSTYFGGMIGDLGLVIGK